MSQCFCSGNYDEEVNDTSSMADSSNDNIWPVPPRWTSKHNHKSILLSEENDTRYVPDLTLPEIIEKSSKFPIPFPIETIRCDYLKEKTSPNVLEKNINSTYPVIHENALYLCSTFLSYQIEYGNSEFYRNMSLVQFINRLLEKRAVTFVGTPDHYLLLDGTDSHGGWEFVGTSNEKPPLILENCLSYDEIKLSALLSVSSHTCFINNGSRRNRGVPEDDPEKIETTGVIVGLIGTRLTKQNVMEHMEIVKRDRSASLQMKFLEFYGNSSSTFKEMFKRLNPRQERYIDLGRGRYFDKVMYERRIILSIDTLLIEANDRAKKEKMKAFVYVVGIGLGVWRICTAQNQLFAATCAKRLECLNKQLTNVSDVYFAYIGETNAGPYKDGDQIGGITIHFGTRNPHEKLTGVHDGKLLVVSYAWDGNALPGNEFWYGSLDTSGDPAAACSTQVAELHNWHINGKLRGSNLMVATLEHGLVTFREYQELHKND